jgi:hypothetical protein
MRVAWADPAHWTKMDSVVVGRGSGGFVYDAGHRTVYSTDDAYGIWRMTR